ncbi:hypothetical protein [Pyrobaculum aerophilum]|uniref:hypothetical protein n=1 Tax=Pyrobaculum aerophilum TaxID=13773 RepID=UPI0023F12082|nr:MULTISPECIES: hypothetical protein [Pyrobaculum]MCX8137936.1 hypothetical protein [Pyrobaculum aerophilum]
MEVFIASVLLAVLMAIGLVAHLKTNMPKFLKAVGVAQLALAIGIALYVAVTPLSPDEVMYYLFLAAVLWALSYMERSKWRNVRAVR